MKRLKANNEKINNEIKIKINKDGSYKYTTEGSLLDRFKADIFGEADPGNMTEEQKNISAGDMVQFLSGDSKFALFGEDGEKYSEEELKEYGITPLIVDPAADAKEAEQLYQVQFTDMAQVKDMDAVVIAVAHDAFLKLDHRQLAGFFNPAHSVKVLADIKGILDRKKMEETGYSYWRL